MSSISTNKFPSTLPIDITFFNAESLSPAKLNNIFSYIRNGAYSIEMFLGNGIDYGDVNYEDKKLIGNLSNIIGSTDGNVYAKFNLLGTNYNLYKKYFSTYDYTGIKKLKTYEHGSYSKETDILYVIEEVNIPVMKDGPLLFGIHYEIRKKYDGVIDSETAVKCTINTISGNPENTNSKEIISSTSTDSGVGDTKFIPSYTSMVIPENNYLSHITFKNNNPEQFDFMIYSMYVIDPTSELYPISLKSSLNAGYDNVTDSGSWSQFHLNAFNTIGLDHPSYITCKRPCKWSKRTYNSENTLCNCVALVDGSNKEGYCIGNTYDLYVYNPSDNIIDKKGIPICAGTFELSGLGYEIFEDLIPKDETGQTTLSYDNLYNGIETPSFLVMQSPLSMYTDKYGTLKFHPFVLYRDTSSDLAGLHIQQGDIFVYDTQNTTRNSIIWDAKFFATQHSDIVLAISDKITPGSINGGYSRYLLLTNAIGLSEASMFNANIQDVRLNKNIAVYGD